MGTRTASLKMTAAPAEQSAAAGFDSLPPLLQTLYPHNRTKAVRAAARTHRADETRL